MDFIRRGSATLSNRERLHVLRLNAARAWLEIAGLAMLMGLAAFFIATSWRKWSDPLLDFGEQLYSAWRLSQGAVLYRDVDFLYGPLSQYFNAGVFDVFGRGLIVLAISNLVIFAAISSSIYILFRRSWGALAAWLSTLIFISVFGFSDFVDAGNYNYAAPYAHETIHGILICLLLCFALFRWVESPTATRSFFAGLLFGMTVVLKPEFIFASTVMTCLAGLAYWKRHDLLKASALFYWATAALFPTALFSCYFSCFMPWDRAIAASSRAWLNALDRSLSADPLQMRLLGLDQPWSRSMDQVVATLLACAVIFALAAAVVVAKRKLRGWLLLCGSAILAVTFGWLACCVVNWIEIGRCLFGLTLIYFLVSLGSLLRKPKQTNPDFDVRVLRLLIAGLATALMARMFLNPRIYHYGYYQAALAATLVPAVMIGELPAWLGAEWRARSVAAVGTLAIVLPGIANLAKRSEHRLQLKIMAVASGRDRFYCLSAQKDPLGQIINALTDVLRQKGNGETLLVLPEGEFINYLAYLPNPLPHASFYAGATSNGREAEIVKELNRNPPYWVVIISRDLIGYGIERYGEKPGSGEEILRCVEQNYKQVASIGGDPLDYRERGAILLRRYSR